MNLIVIATLLTVLSSLYDVTAMEFVDTFHRDLCHLRWTQMDWQSIIRPCRGNMQFGRQNMDEKLRTSAEYSHTLSLHFKKAGEFNKITIQSRSADGHPKDIGGDTWRLFIRGPEKQTPTFVDLNNGVYEAKFILMEPGLYKADVALESTLCEAYKDPPQDWGKRDPNTIIGDEKNSKLLWQPLRGGNISFRIEPNTKKYMKDLQNRFSRYKDHCEDQFKCDSLLWSGVGRWASDGQWQPYVDPSYSPNGVERSQGKCSENFQLGVLKLDGDSLLRDIGTKLSNSSLCNDVFQECRGIENEDQPTDVDDEDEESGDEESGSGIESEEDSNRGKSFRTKPFTNRLRTLISKAEMDNSSALLLDYGKTFTENMPFKTYRNFIDRTARILKQKYKGKVLWKNMPLSWWDSTKPQYHFGNYQREMLFNAYATSAMCRAGYPTLDVAQITLSGGDRGQIVDTLSSYVTEYFKRTSGKCD